MSLAESVATITVMYQRLLCGICREAAVGPLQIANLYSEGPNHRSLNLTGPNHSSLTVNPDVFTFRLAEPPTWAELEECAEAAGWIKVPHDGVMMNVCPDCIEKSKKIAHALLRGEVERRAAAARLACYMGGINTDGRPRCNLPANHAGECELAEWAEAPRPDPLPAPAAELPAGSAPRDRSCYLMGSENGNAICVLEMGHPGECKTLAQWCRK